MAPKLNSPDLETTAPARLDDIQHIAPEAEDAEVLLNRVAEALPAGFELDQGRIWKERQGKLSPICAPVVTVARARDADGTGWCHLIRFLAADGTVREIVVSARQLISSPATVVGDMADQGFELWTTAREVCALLRQMEGPEILEAVSVTGWIGENFDTYVMPDGKALTWAGEAAGVCQSRILFTGFPRQMPARQGTVDEWSNRVAGSVLPSLPVAVGICAAIAPIFLSHRNGSSFLLHLSGGEKANAACRVAAASAWGAPGALEISWTKPARELVAAVAHARDGLLIMSGYEPPHAKKVGAVTAALAARDGLPAAGGKIVILSTGSVALMDAGGPDGLSDLRSIVDLDTRSWPVSRADDALAATEELYGSFGSASVKALINYWVRKGGGLREFLKHRCSDLLDTMVRHPARADAETERVSQALGALFGAGNFMINRNILSWDTAELKATFRQLAEQWVAQHRGLLPESERILLAAVADAVAELELELVSLDIEDVSDTAEGPGWHDAQWLYLATPAITQLALEVAHTPDQIIALLKEQGLLKPGMERGHKFRMTSRIAGRPRAFRVSRDLLRFAANEIPENLPA